MSDYLEPLKAELRAVEKDLRELETHLAERRREAGRLRKGLYALDPAWAAEQRRSRKGGGPGSTARRADGSYAISKEKLDTLHEYVREHFGDGSTFVAKDLPLDELGMSTATRSQALNALQEQGLVRLDKLGKTGGAKHWALITADG